MYNNINYDFIRDFPNIIQYNPTGVVLWFDEMHKIGFDNDKNDLSLDLQSIDLPKIIDGAYDFLRRFHSSAS